MTWRISAWTPPRAGPDLLASRCRCRAVCRHRRCRDGKAAIMRFQGVEGKTPLTRRRSSLPTISQVARSSVRRRRYLQARGVPGRSSWTEAFHHRSGPRFRRRSRADWLQPVALSPRRSGPIRMVLLRPRTSSRSVLQIDTDAPGTFQTDSGPEGCRRRRHLGRHRRAAERSTSFIDMEYVLLSTITLRSGQKLSMVPTLRRRHRRALAAIARGTGRPRPTQQQQAARRRSSSNTARPAGS